MCSFWFLRSLFWWKGPAVNLSKQKVYGEPLLSHLSQSDREIAVPIQECIHMLLRTGMKEEVGLRKTLPLLCLSSFLTGIVRISAGFVPSGCCSFSDEEAEDVSGPGNRRPQRVQDGPARCGR